MSLARRTVICGRRFQLNVRIRCFRLYTVTISASPTADYDLMRRTYLWRRCVPCNNSQSCLQGGWSSETTTL